MTFKQRWGLAALYVAWVVAIAIIRVSNPQLTETQLMLTFWPHMLVGALLTIGCLIALNRVAK